MRRSPSKVVTVLPADAGPILCGLARAGIERALSPSDRTQPRPPSATWLDEPGAAFVTLTQQGALRGCIGTLQAWRPLRVDVAQNAVAAATRDGRFRPLRPDELPVTAIEVSVLSPPEPIPAGTEAEVLAGLRPYHDGVILTFGDHRGTFLPQVWEQLPTPERFLAHLKRKAGLAEDWWHPDVVLQRYGVTAFHEEPPMDRRS